MKIYTKQQLIEQLKRIRKMGWVPNVRPGNAGGVGNTVEDFLGIEENNLPIPNAAEWELKCQRAAGQALTTLFHMEPSPRAIRFVPRVLLQNYGWPHQHIPGEMSFRQTITPGSFTDRGFTAHIDYSREKVLVSFDSSRIDKRHTRWKRSVERRAGLGELDPQPYWGLQDLVHKAGTKLLNCFYLVAETTRIEGIEHFKYSSIMVLERFSGERFIEQIDKSNILIDFDARTGHNHGTKFRMRPRTLKDLYASIVEI